MGENIISRGRVAKGGVFFPHYYREKKFLGVFYMEGEFS